MRISNSTFRVSNFSLLTSKSRLTLFAFLIFNFVFASNVFTQIASGGNYTLEKSVTVNGGASGSSASAGGNFTVEGAIGQTTGIPQQNSPFVFQAGFWTADPLIPTAAAVNLGGRVMTAQGIGISNAHVVLTMPNGVRRYALSSSFGYYSFTDVIIGETYILTASAKQYTFANPVQIVSLLDERDDVDFITTESP